MSNTREFDLGNFRQALGSFTTGVTVVTTRADNGWDIGITANSFNSVSLDPPMVLWSLGKSSGSLSAFMAAEHFSVHILASDQQNLSAQFATRGKDKFADVEIERGPDEIPLLRDYAARFICRSEFRYEGGDHIIFVGRVVEFDHTEAEPLLFHGGQYAQLVRKQEFSDSDLSHDWLGYLLARAYQQLIAPLKKELAARSLNIAQFYLLNLALSFEGRTIDQLLDVLELGDSVPTDEEVQQLLDKNILEMGQDGAIKLTTGGHQLHMELASVFKAAEADAESDLSYDQRQNLKLSLHQLIRTTAKDLPDSWP